MAEHEDDETASGWGRDLEQPLLSRRDDRHDSAASFAPTVRRCKLDPNLKAPGFKGFNLMTRILLFNLNPGF